MSGISSNSLQGGTILLRRHTGDAKIHFRFLILYYPFVLECYFFCSLLRLSAILTIFLSSSKTTSKEHGEEFVSMISHQIRYANLRFIRLQPLFPRSGSETTGILHVVRVFYASTQKSTIDFDC